MKYLLLIYQSKPTDELLKEVPDIYAQYGAFRQSIIDSGNFVGGNALQPITTATTVRVQDGKTLTTDGPFAETREQLLGYFMIEAPHLDDAIAIAARIPSARYGSIEVRPIRSTV